MSEELLVVMRLPAGAGDLEAELAADRLWSQGATAVEIRTAAHEVTVAAGFPTEDAAAMVAERIGAELVKVTSEWRDAWKKWMEPVAIPGGLVVAPAWKPVPVGDDELVLHIDPGPCFGSGTHASTRMILGWLAAHRPKGAIVNDVGTGSGILAVAAARLGAARVTAIDVDPDAVAVTQRNAENNGVAAVVAASTHPVCVLPSAAADLLLVNVTAAVHAQIGPDCVRAARPGAKVVIAGLLPGQWQHVADAYTPAQPIEHLALDGWEGRVLEVTAS